MACGRLAPTKHIGDCTAEQIWLIHQQLRHSGRKDEANKAQAEGGKPCKAPQALLPEAKNRIYMAAWQNILGNKEQGLQALAHHNGTACAAHIPAHALDVQRVKVLYLPSELTAYS